MPGPWTPEHRAAYQATMERRRQRKAGLAPSGTSPIMTPRVQAQLRDITREHIAEASAASFEAERQRLVERLTGALTDSVASELGAVLLRIENHVLVLANEVRQRSIVEPSDARLERLENAVLALAARLPERRK